MGGVSCIWDAPDSRTPPSIRTDRRQVKPDLAKAIEALKGKGAEGKVGIVGFCWGGKISTLACQVGKEGDARLTPPSIHRSIHPPNELLDQSSPSHTPCSQDATTYGASASAHPSFLTVEDAAVVNTPILLLPSKDEADLVRLSFLHTAGEFRVESIHGIHHALISLIQQPRTLLLHTPDALHRRGGGPRRGGGAAQVSRHAPRVSTQAAAVTVRPRCGSGGDLVLDELIDRLTDWAAHVFTEPSPTLFPQCAKCALQVGGRPRRLERPRAAAARHRGRAALCRLLPQAPLRTTTTTTTLAFCVDIG